MAAPISGNSQRFNVPQAPRAGIPIQTSKVKAVSTQYLDHMARIRPIELSDYLEAGKMDLRTGQLNSAIILFSLFQCRSPKKDWPEALFHRALAYQKGGDLQFALDDLEAIISNAEKRGKSHYTEIEMKAISTAIDFHMENKNFLRALELKEKVELESFRL